MKQFFTLLFVITFTSSYSQNYTENTQEDIKDVIEDVKVKVYPNPFSDYISIDSDGYEYDPVLLTISGKQMDISYNSYGNIDTKELASGVYVLILNMGNYEKSFKLIKE